jgi:hypothetical protein
MTCRDDDDDAMLLFLGSATKGRLLLVLLLAPPPLRAAASGLDRPNSAGALSDPGRMAAEAATMAAPSTVRSIVWALAMPSTNNSRDEVLVAFVVDGGGVDELRLVLVVVVVILLMGAVHER